MQRSDIDDELWPSIVIFQPERTITRPDHQKIFRLRQSGAGNVTELFGLVTKCHNNLTMSVCHAGLGSECTLNFTIYTLPNIKMNKLKTCRRWG